MNEFTVSYTVGGEHGSSATVNTMHVSSDLDPPPTGLWKVTNDGKDQWVNVGRISSIWRDDPVVVSA